MRSFICALALVLAPLSALASPPVTSGGLGPNFPLPIQVNVSSTATNAPVEAVRVSAASTGTAASGFGSRTVYTAEDTGGTQTAVGYLDATIDGVGGGTFTLYGVLSDSELARLSLAGATATLEGQAINIGMAYATPTISIGSATSTVNIAQPGANVQMIAWDPTHDGEISIVGRNLSLDDGGASVGTLTTNGLSTLTVTDAATTTPVTVLKVRATSSGTPGSGFGPSVAFESEPTTGGAAVEMGSIYAATDTTASTSGVMWFAVRAAGTLTNIFALSGLSGLSGFATFARPVNLNDTVGLVGSLIIGNTFTATTGVGVIKLSNQTADPVVVGTPTSSNTVFFMEFGDVDFDRALASQSNPTVCFTSANQSTSQFWCGTHDTTNPRLTSYLGAFIFSRSGGGTAIQTDSDQNIIAGGGGIVGARSTSTGFRENNGVEWFAGSTRGLWINGSRFQLEYATVASAGDLTLPAANTIGVTGTTTINAITTTNWEAGAEVGFIFAASVTVKNDTAGGAGTATMLLEGGTDYSATANDTLVLRYNGTNWIEFDRSVN